MKTAYWTSVLMLAVAVTTGQNVVSKQECGGKYEGKEGTVTSPGFGTGRYPSNANCVWTISVDEGHVVRLEFEALDIEQEETCSFDGVSLYDATEGGGAPSSSRPLLGGASFCGDERYSAVHSSTNAVGVHFYSDQDSEGGGFELKWKAVPAATEDQFNCTFEEGLCRGWSNAPSPLDQFDWTLHRQRTPTSGTGPSFDHTLGNRNGRYLYIEASAPRRWKDEAILTSPSMNFDDDDSSVCISFWYQMYGSSTGILRVEMVVDGNGTTVWERQGAQGVGWLQGAAEISRTDQPLQILFIGIRGRLMYGDIAIDDIVKTRGPCVSYEKNELVPPTAPSGGEAPGLIEPPLPDDIVCSSDFYKCISGTTCIASVFSCDGFDDCPDGDDEAGCAGDATTTPQETVGGRRDASRPTDFSTTDGVEDWDVNATTSGGARQTSGRYEATGDNYDVTTSLEKRKTTATQAQSTTASTRPGDVTLRASNAPTHDATRAGGEERSARTEQTTLDAATTRAMAANKTTMRDRDEAATTKSTRPTARAMEVKNITNVVTMETTMTGGASRVRICAKPTISVFAIMFVRWMLAAM